jgi:hypothetical protein
VDQVTCNVRNALRLNLAQQQHGRQHIHSHAVILILCKRSRPAAEDMTDAAAQRSSGLKTWGRSQSSMHVNDRSLLHAF